MSGECIDLPTNLVFLVCYYVYLHCFSNWLIPPCPVYQGCKKAILLSWFSCCLALVCSLVPELCDYRHAAHHCRLFSTLQFADLSKTVWQHQMAILFTSLQTWTLHEVKKECFVRHEDTLLQNKRVKVFSGLKLQKLLKYENKTALQSHVTFIPVVLSWVCI